MFIVSSSVSPVPSVTVTSDGITATPFSLSLVSTFTTPVAPVYPLILFAESFTASITASITVTVTVAVSQLAVFSFSQIV
ncbi:hypothetical protein D3C87_1911940 [compost metagenome]